MRWPSPFRDRRTDVDLQLTPMIDCVFLLMVYFLWSSSFAVVELTLPSELSVQPGGSGPAIADAPPPPEADFDAVVVRVRPSASGPAWEVNGTPAASLAEVRSALQAIARIKPDVPVILDPESEAILGDVIDVFDVSRLAGLENIQFSAAADVDSFP